MSVLIHGMNMPYSCADCDFCSGLIMPDDIYTCECDAGEIAGTDITKYVEAEEPTFPEWCPLEEVSTPHGDLIDAFTFRREMDTNYPFDKFTQSKYGEANAAKSTILMMLGKAPIIIKAEE